MSVQFSQKKGMSKLSYTFMPEHFYWEYTDGSSSGSANISYLSVPSECSTRVERNRWLMNVGLLWVGLAIFARVYQVITGTYLGISPLGIFGAGVALWAYYMPLRFSVFDLGGSSLYILKDKKHDSIIQEIMGRRNELLRETYFNEDSLGGDEEILEWLLKEGVITEEEKNRRLLNEENVPPDVH